MATGPTDLFVYGTLLDVHVRRRVIGRSCRTLAVTLAGYSRREGRYAYLAADPTATVGGLLFRALTPTEFERLDAYEGVGPTLIEGAQRRLYTRAEVDVRRRDGRRLDCWVYLANLAEWPAAWRKR